MPNIVSRLIQELPLVARRRQRFRPETRAHLPALKHGWGVLLSASTRMMRQTQLCHQALRGERPFSMAFIRAQCTLMCVSAFSMLRQQQALTRRGHPAQSKALNRLCHALDGLIRCPSPPSPSEPPLNLILPMTRIDRNASAHAGVRAAYLGDIKNTFPDIHIPEGFVVTSAGHDLFFGHNELHIEINRRVQATQIRTFADMCRMSSQLQQLIINQSLPDELQASIHAAYRDLEAAAGHRGVRVALRSSAIGENTADHPFAGHYRTEINVSEDLLFTAYKEILASSYSLTAMNARFRHGLKDEDHPLAIYCLAMTDTTSAGVMYTRHPIIAGSTSIYIHAAHGLAKAITEGRVNPDVWEITRPPNPRVLRRIIREKSKRCVSFLSEEGVSLLPTPASQRHQSALSEDQAMQLARLGAMLEEHFGSALDIEWSFSKTGQLSLLQVRPLANSLPAPRMAPGAAPNMAPNPEAGTEAGSEADTGADTGADTEADTGADTEAGAAPGARQDIACQWSEVPARGEQIASPGCASGRAFVIRNNKDLLHFPDQAVLITETPLSRWSAVLPRASALVIERSGSTFGHLAGIAREYGIPALMGVKGATTLFTPGTMIMVDARRQCVLSAPPDSSPVRDGAPRRSFHSTPVHHTLRRVMDKVGPLSRINPLEPRVSMDNMATLNDLAHTCLLQACRQVLELSHITGILRPLAVAHPANWWVLDLDDQRLDKGQDPGTASAQPFFSANRPVLDALWQGIASREWTLFTNSTRRHPILRWLRRLRAAVRTLSTPRPRIFILSQDCVHLHLSLERALFCVQARTGPAARENALCFLWHWIDQQTPPQAWLDQLIAVLAKHGFQTDQAVDGLFIWQANVAHRDIPSLTRFLGFLIGHVQSSTLNTPLPENIADLFPGSP